MADPGFWSGGPSFDPRGALSPKVAQNRGFPLKLPENCMILKKSLAIPGSTGGAEGQTTTDQISMENLFWPHAAGCCLLHLCCHAFTVPPEHSTTAPLLRKAPE